MGHTRSTPSGCSFHCLESEAVFTTHLTVPQLFQWYGRVYSLRAWQSHLIPLPSYMVWRGLLFQVVLDLMTLSTANLSWRLNLVILVWWSGIRLMNLCTPGWWGISLLDHKFILVWWVRCPLKPTSLLTQAVRIIPFWTRQWRTLNMVWILFSQTLVMCQS